VMAETVEDALVGIKKIQAGLSPKV
jgi:hypothetical protein